MGTLGFVLVAAALVVFVVILGLVRRARQRRRAERSYLAKETGGDDSPTGYVQGVWLLGGGDLPKSHDHHGSGHHSSHDSAGSSTRDGGGAGTDGGGAN